LSSLAIPVTFTQNDFVQIQNVCDELLDTQNLIDSGNLATLVDVYLFRQTEVYSAAECENVVYLRQIKNLLFLVRQVINSVYQEDTTNLYEESDQVFDVLQLFPGRPELFQNYVSSIVNLSCNIECSPITFELHIELQMSFITLMSEQMLIPVVETPQTAFNLAISNLPGELVQKLVKTWLSFVLIGNKFDDGKMSGDSLPTGNHFTSSMVQCSRISNVTDVNANSYPVIQSSSWASYFNPFKMLYVPSLANGSNSLSSQSSSKIHKSMQDSNRKNANSSSFSSSLPDSLSKHSLILLLLTANQRVNTGSEEESDQLNDGQQTDGQTSGPVDCYKKTRHGLFKFSHIGQSSECFEIDLQNVYRWLAANQHMEAATLFLYTLIRGNKNVKAYILSRMDLDTIVMQRDKIIFILHITKQKNRKNVFIFYNLFLIFLDRRSSTPHTKCEPKFATSPEWPSTRATVKPTSRLTVNESS